MKKPIAVLTADNHVGPRIWDRLPDITGDAYFGLRQVIDVALQYDVDLLVGGDFFDSAAPSPEDLWQSVEALRRLREKSRSLYFIQGDHEKRPRPWLSLFPGTCWLHNEVTKIHGVSFTGLDFCKPDEFRLFCAEPPRADVLITHQKWLDLIPFDASGVNIDDLPAYRLVFSGDFHKCFQRPMTKGGIFVSSGPSVLTAVDEDPQKYVILLYDDLSFETISLAGRRILRLIVRNDEELAAACAAVAETTPVLAPGLERTVAQIKYADHMPDVVRAVTEAAHPDVRLWFVPYRHGDVVEIRPDRTQDIDVRTCLQRFAAPGSALYEDLAAVVAAKAKSQIEAVIDGISTRFECSPGSTSETTASSSTSPPISLPA